MSPYEAADTAKPDDSTEAEKPKTKPVKLPSLEQMVQWFETWESATMRARERAELCRDYYDGKQWSEEEIQKLAERNQPLITVNRIARKVNFLLGEEIRKRVDPQALPRTPQHEDGAKAITDSMRYVEEAEDVDVIADDVFGDLIVEGYGAAITDAESDDDEVEVRCRLIPWDRFWYDPHARRPDFLDGKYLGAVNWFDEDDAAETYPEEKYPGAADVIAAAIDSDAYGAMSETTDDKPKHIWSDPKRKRVKICEVYFRVGKEWYVAHFTKGGFVCTPRVCTYTDEKGRARECPITAMSCYIDRENNRYGVVHNLISLQDEINKRRSKALHLISVAQMVYEKNSVKDPQKAMLEKAKPDGAIEVQPGALQNGAVQFMDGTQMAQGQFEMLQEAKNEIDTVGPSSATLPDLPGSASGRAYLARQTSASQEMESVFRNMRLWRKATFRQIWLRIRQFWTYEKWLRVTDDEELTGR
jgi:hypothetical protein